MLVAGLAIPLSGCSVLRHAAAVGPVAASIERPVHVSLSVKPGSYLGVRELGTPASYKPVEKFTAATKIHPNLVLYYGVWGQRFKTAFARSAYAHGAIPLVQINPFGVSMTAIVAGEYDRYLRTYATSVRSFGHPVVIGFAHEMNGNWYPWGMSHTPPAVWVAAWRHVVTVFRQQGAGNVTWLWTISSGAKNPTVLARYWPGKSWVTWAGVDGYFYSPSSFAKIFGPDLRAIRRLAPHLPILVAETGIGQVAGKVRTMPRLFSGVRRSKLLGLVWYDVAQHKGVYHQDWRLEGNKEAVRAFRRAVEVYLRLRSIG